MIDVIPLSACHTEQYGTISVTSLLSFNNYFDPRNAAFGSLLVFNDYRVPPAAGFKMHPHHNCEQLFFVVEGTQKCVDTLNNSLVLKPVTVQRVTAGTGYARETANYGNSMLRFMSVRFQPRCLHTHPYHEMRTFSPSLMADHLLNVVSGRAESPSKGLPLPFDVDADVYLPSLEQTPLEHFVPAGSKTFIYVVSGRIRMDRQILQPGDHVRVSGPETVSLAAAPRAWLIVIDMR